MSLFSSENDSSDSSGMTDDGLDVVMMSQVVAPNYFKTTNPCYTSRLQGSNFVSEFLNGHPVRMYNALRMPKDTFLLLCDTLPVRGFLRDSQTTPVPIMEAVAIFLQTVGLHHRQRDNAERFQHSTETVHRHVRRITRALVQLAPEIITPPDWNNVHPKILTDPRLTPYFNNCVGAVDGTLISACAPKNRRNAYRSRKAIISQNVLAICDFNLLFTYVYPGWEGSANDARVLSDAISRDPNFPIPPAGKYYLVDGGYCNYSYFLSPYHNTRYRIHEYCAGSRQARRPKELFNQQHARLRNVIERMFGVLKSRFPILRGLMPYYALRSQSQMVIASCAVHNFIRRASSNGHFFMAKSSSFASDVDPTNDIATTPSNLTHSNTSQAEIDEQPMFRDYLAKWMWEIQGQ